MSSDTLYKPKFFCLFYHESIDQMALVGFFAEQNTTLQQSWTGLPSCVSLFCHIYFLPPTFPTKGFPPLSQGEVREG